VRLAPGVNSPRGPTYLFALAGLFLLPVSVLAQTGTPVPAAPAPVAAPVPQQELTGAADPRYPFSLELSGTAGMIGSFAGFGASPAAFGGGLTFGMPIQERRQILIAASAATGQSPAGSTLAAGGGVGYRIMTYQDFWRLRFDTEVVADYSRTVAPAVNSKTLATFTGFGLGGRLAVGWQYYPAPVFGVGVEVALAVLGISAHVDLDAATVITFNW